MTAFLISYVVGALRSILGFDVFSEDASLDAHGLHFLQEQFGSVRNFDLANECRPANTHGALAFVGHLFQVCVGGDSASFADMNTVLIRVDKEAISDKVGATMRDETIAFHFPHTKSSVSRATF